MTPAVIAIHLIIGACLALAVGGLVVRGRARLCWCFSVLLSLALVGSLLPVISDRFYVWDFWAYRQIFYSGLYLGMALELSLKLFPAALPRARLRAVTVACGGCLLTAAVAVLAADGSARNILVAVLPALRAGAAWLLASLLVLAVYFQVPIHSFHKVVMVGTALYHCTFVALLGLVGNVGWHMRDVFNALDPPFYAATAALWAFAAWRPEPAPALSPATKALLQPWAAQ